MRESVSVLPGFWEKLPHLAFSVLEMQWFVVNGMWKLHKEQDEDLITYYVQKAPLLV